MLGGLDESRLMGADTSEERQKLSDMVELYSIMQTTEHLESMYVKDLISAEEYKAQCMKLLRAYEMQKQKLVSMGAIADIYKWMLEYSIALPQAVRRLEIDKLPATDVHGTEDTRRDSVIVVETTTNIITALDLIRLKMSAIDEVLPSVASTLESLNKHTWLPFDFEPKAKLRIWVRDMNAMAASDSLSAAQVRQLALDLEMTYERFKNALAGGAS